MANFPLQADSACATSVSRRALLKAAPAVTATILLASPALASGAGSAQTPKDADFWQAHAEWAAIRAAWNADTELDEEAVWARYNDRDTAAFEQMMLAPASTASAILAKHKAANLDASVPEPVAVEAIERDLALLSMRENV
jgi:hypothetical protein